MKKQLFNIILISGSTIIAWIINYLYHPIMLRYLDLEKFAEIESLLSLLNLIWVLFAAISLFLVKQMVKHEDKIKSISDFSFKYLSITWIFVYLLFLSTIPIISAFLQLEDLALLAILGLTIFLSFCWLHQWAFLQAREEFKFVSLSNVLLAVFRMAFSLGLVILGFALYGAVWGIILAQATVFFIMFLIVKSKKNKLSNIDINEKEIYKDFKKQKSQILNYFIWAVIITFFMNSDILFAKHFFDNTSAWTYAWLSVIWKLVLFVVFSIETVYYPILTRENKLNKFLIWKLSILYIWVILWAIWFFYFFWEFILHLFKPWFEKYLDLIYLIFIYAWFVGFISLIVKTLIAFEKYLINYVLVTFSLIFISSLYLFNFENIYNFFYVFLANIFIALVLSIWSLIFAWKKK